MRKRRRLNPRQSFEELLASHAQEMRERAARLNPGVERDNLLMRAEQADTASHLDGSVNSPGLQRSK